MNEWEGRREERGGGGGEEVSQKEKGRIRGGLWFRWIFFFFLFKLGHWCREREEEDNKKEEVGRSASGLAREQEKGGKNREKK